MGLGNCPPRPSQAQNTLRHKSKRETDGDPEYFLLLHIKAKLDEASNCEKRMNLLTPDYGYLLRRCQDDIDGGDDDDDVRMLLMLTVMVLMVRMVTVMMMLLMVLMVRTVMMLLMLMVMMVRIMDDVMMVIMVTMMMIIMVTTIEMGAEARAESQTRRVPSERATQGKVAPSWCPLLFASGLRLCAAPLMPDTPPSCRTGTILSEPFTEVCTDSLYVTSALW